MSMHESEKSKSFSIARGNLDLMHEQECNKTQTLEECKKRVNMKRSTTGKKRCPNGLTVERAYRLKGTPFMWS